MKDPRPGLDLLGVEWVQVVDPNDGYDGAYDPEFIMLHWTASAAGSDVSDHVVAINDYHACVSRSGVAKLGGWNVKQAHGGSGRTQPIDVARQGTMTVDQLVGWQNNPAGDNTDSAPNRYGVAVAIDNNGVGEPVPNVQWHAFTATAAVLLDCIGRTGPGWLIDHASSTNRKIDLATSAALPPAWWYADIATQLELLQGGPHAVTELLDMCPTPDGGGYYILTNTGNIYTYGNAHYGGGLARQDGTRLTNSPPKCVRVHPKKGYWIGVADGGVFSFDGAPFHGSATNDFPD